MMKTQRMLSILGVALLAVVAQRPALAQAREEAKLLVAAEVLDELRAQRDQAIPERLLQRAYGVAVIPVGRQGGIRSRRSARQRCADRARQPRPLQQPAVRQSHRGQRGLADRRQETDIVLVFTTRRGVEGIADGKLTLGAGASAAAGPVGRQAEVAAGVNAEVFAYSRARGLFAGVALDGTAITMDNKGNRNFYDKKGVLPSEIMSGAVTTSSENSPALPGGTGRQHRRKRRGGSGRARSARDGIRIRFDARRATGRWRREDLPDGGSGAGQGAASLGLE